MKTAGLYDIAIAPVDATAEIRLALIIAGIAVLASIGFAIWQRLADTDRYDLPWRAILATALCAATAYGALIFWSQIGSAVDETVDNRIASQIEQIAGLHNIKAISGDEVLDGFVAVDDEGQAYIGTVTETGTDHYQIMVTEFK